MYHIEIKVDAPIDQSKGSYRPNVFHASLDSELDVNVIQQEVVKLFAALTEKDKTK